MYTKSLLILYTTLMLIVSLAKCQKNNRFLDGSGRDERTALAKMINMRCTHRFSPGECVEEVAPVWTFVFLQQNCTERLGCRNNFRTNRFRSYRMCMKRCRPLVDILKMVDIEEITVSEKNDTESDAEDKNETYDQILRESFEEYYITKSGSKKEIKTKFEDLNQDFEEEYKEQEQDTRFIVYKDTNVNEDIMPVNVDSVPGEIRSEFDVLHL